MVTGRYGPVRCTPWTTPAEKVRRSGSPRSTPYCLAAAAPRLPACATLCTPHCPPRGTPSPVPPRRLHATHAGAGQRWPPWRASPRLLRRQVILEHVHELDGGHGTAGKEVLGHPIILPLDLRIT